MLDLPDDVRQKQQPGKRRGQPYPATREEAARGREQQRGKNGGAKEERGVFVLQAQPGKGAKQQPPARLVALDGQHHAIQAACPQQRFEGVHGVQAVQGEINNRAQDGQAGERDSSYASAQLLGEFAGKNHQCGRRHRWQQMNGE